MAWALSAGFASTWPLFKSACLSQNWSAAAQNCQISTAGNAVVGPRNTADVLLFNNAQAVATQKLYYSVLHSPNSVSATPSSGSGSGTGGTSAVSNGSGNVNSARATGGTASSTQGAGRSSVVAVPEPPQQIQRGRPVNRVRLHNEFWDHWQFQLAHQLYP